MSITDLLPASFRGVPFAIRSNNTQGGRRNAEHEYPGRDGLFPEDLGRRGRRYRFRGFIVSDSAVYGGGPVAVQRQLIIAAAELGGPGILIHPTLGLVTVSVDSYSIDDDLDAATTATVEWSFIEYTKQVFPLLTASTVAIVTTAALAVDAAASLAFEVSAASGGSSTSASTAWSAAITTAGQDATSLVNLASQLPGQYGRFFAGSNQGYISSSAYSGDTTVAQLVSAASEARAAISTAAAAVNAQFTALTSSSSATAATAVQSLVGCLLNACADPSDAIRILTSLAQTSTSVTSVDDLFRRAVVTAAARAASSYQPSSYDDAVSLQGSITTLLDAEILNAGDEGDDTSYSALKALRVAVVADLQARGGQLSSLKSFNFSGPLPALVLANLLYGDASRADQLVSEADPVNPLFMPSSFEALAS